MLAQQDYRHFQHHSSLDKHGSSCTLAVDGASACELPDCRIASDNRNSPHWRILIFLKPAYSCPANLTKHSKTEQQVVIILKILKIVSTPPLSLKFLGHAEGAQTCSGSPRTKAGPAGLQLHPSPGAVTGLGLHNVTTGPFLMAHLNKHPTSLHSLAGRLETGNKSTVPE